MTGRKSTKGRKRPAKTSQQAQKQHPLPAPDPQQVEAQDDLGSPPANIKREQPPPTQTVKKIMKAENDEAKTLKTVFKSNPDSQMKDFIKKAVVAKPTQPTRSVAKTAAETHPPAVSQELLDTDDDVADNLAKLFKASKSYKNV